MLVHGVFGRSKTYYSGKEVDPKRLNQRAGDYWRGNDKWDSFASYIMAWPNKGRLEKSVASMLRIQFKDMAERGKCKEEACIFVTHSTGDLVLRYSLSRLSQWAREDGWERDDIKIAASMDISGAGSGSMPYTHPLHSKIDSLDGKGENILRDLTRSKATSIATGSYHVPRFRFASIAKHLNRNDRIVGMRSACGSRRPKVTLKQQRSCHPDLQPNGRLNPGEPAIRNRFPNHYPLFMMNNLKHTDGLIETTHRDEHKVSAWPFHRYYRSDNNAEFDYSKMGFKLAFETTVNRKARTRQYMSISNAKKMTIRETFFGLLGEEVNKARLIN